MSDLHGDVVIIGSGMGGATTALALARRGVDVLVLERGERLPREPAELVRRRRCSSTAATSRTRPGSTAAGAPFSPGVHYVVGGNTKVYGASLPRLREARLRARSSTWRDVARLAVPLRDLEPYYGRGRAAARRARDPRRGPDRAVAQHAVPVPRRSSTSRTSPTWPSACAPRACTRARTRWASTCRPGGTCIRCATCDGFPCWRGAKCDAETCAIDPALATGPRAWRPAMRVSRIVRTDGRRVDHLLADGPDGPLRSRAGSSCSPPAP